MTAAKKVPSLTPEARLERAKKLITEGVSELVEAHLERGAALSEWVDQNGSPLGKRRHLELVRAGTLPATKEGGRVLVRRADLNHFLTTSRSVVPTQAPVDLDDVDAMIEQILEGAK